MTTLKTHTPATLTVPLGSTFGAWLFLSIGAAIDAVQRLLHRRTHAVVMSSRVVEASRLRRHAQGFLSADPRFAADLFAAADRHERME